MFYPNLLLIGGALLIIVGSSVHRGRVAPILTTDGVSRARIALLEREVAQTGQGPSEAALSLARLYAQAGEFPWADDTLKKAEARGGREMGWRLNLGLTYLEVGRNDEAERVLGEALAQCQETPCGTHLEARLAIFKRAAELLRQRGIDGRRTPERALRTLREILKPIGVEVPAENDAPLDAGAR